MLKEDPEDLTHLAPTAGDVCVPLDETPIEYVLPDMLDDIILSDCNLLSVDKVEGYLSASPNSYFNYEDDLESLSRPLSPMLSQVRRIFCIVRIRFAGSLINALAILRCRLERLKSI